MEELLKNKIVQMRPLVKPRTFKKLLLKNNEAQVHELQYGEYPRHQKAKYKYSTGEHMRKAINKGTFSKSYKFKSFSEKLYEIIDTDHTNPPMYHLKDLRTGNVLDGAVNQEQLQRVRDDT